jgi:hypothetical protein
MAGGAAVMGKLTPQIYERLSLHRSRLVPAAKGYYALCCLCAARGDRFAWQKASLCIHTDLGQGEWAPRYLCGPCATEVLGYRNAQRQKRAKEIRKSQAFELKERETRPEYYRRMILRFLSPGSTPKSVREILDLIQSVTLSPVSREGVYTTAKALADEGLLVRRQRGHIDIFRGRLELKPGLAVVENPNTQSQRFGWVEKTAMVQGREFPVVRFLNGVRAISSDDLLDVVREPEMLKQIEMAQAIARGETPIDFVPIPWYLFDGLITQKRGRSRVNAVRLMEIAQHIGIAGEKQRQLNDLLRNRTISYLDLYYPGWRSPGFVGGSIAS